MKLVAGFFDLELGVCLAFDDHGLRDVAEQVRAIRSLCTHYDRITILHTRGLRCAGFDRFNRAPLCDAA